MICLPASFEYFRRFLSAVKAAKDVQIAIHRTSRSAKPTFDSVAVKSARMSFGRHLRRRETESKPSSRRPRSDRFSATQNASRHFVGASSAATSPSFHHRWRIPIARLQWQTARPTTHSAIASDRAVAAGWTTVSTWPILSRGTKVSWLSHKAIALILIELSRWRTRLEPLLNWWLRFPSLWCSLLNLSQPPSLEFAMPNCSSTSSQSPNRNVAQSTRAA